MTLNYNSPLQAVANREAFVIAGMMVGTFVSFLLGIFNPASANNAGPDWLWMGGKNDIIRNLYFRPRRQLPPLRARGASLHAVRRLGRDVLDASSSLSLAHRQQP
jgi:hypothetical protein